MKILELKNERIEIKSALDKLDSRLGMTVSVHELEANRFQFKERRGKKPLEKE